MYLRVQTFNLYYIMALTFTGLNDLTGLFPGATSFPAGATAGQDLGQGVDLQGYIGIPLNSIRYTGSHPNKWTQGPLGTGNADVTNGGGVSNADDNTCVTGSFRNFIRGINESAYHYTTGSLTGTNAYTYWNSTVGSFSVYDSTHLSRTYSSTIYYEYGDSLATTTDV